MFVFDKIDFQRIAISSVGALLLSTACVVGAVAPARAASVAPQTVAGWQQDVEARIVRDVRLASPRLDNVNRAATRLSLRFDEAGQYQGADIIASSGNRIANSAALRVANALRYPALPSAMAGKSVQMVLYFGSSEADVALAQRDLKAEEQIAYAKKATIQLASR